MQLWLMRHGLAMDPDSSGSDAARLLSAAGEQQVASVGRWLKSRSAPPELVWNSPLARARQTAEVLNRELGLLPEAVRGNEHLAPGVNWQELLSEANRQFVERLACVGHEPDLSRGLAEMVGGGRVLFSPGTIACIEFPGAISLGQGRLRWLLAADFF